MAFNDTNSRESQSLFEAMAKGLVLSVMALITVAGNALSLFVLVTTGKWNTRFLIASLAVTDLLLGALVVPFAAVSSIKLQWIFGHMWCQTQGSLGFLLCQASVITITSITIERHMLFTRPNLHFKWFRKSPERTQYIVIFTWTFAGLWTFIAWQTSRFFYANELLNCVVDWRYNRRFTLVCGLITSCVPICVILFCNFKVVKILRRWKLKKSGTPDETLKRDIAEVKISRMLLVVVVVFLVCWTPYSVGGICYLLEGCVWPDEFFTVSVFLCLLNSCINPIIYGTFDRRFRRAVRMILASVFSFLNKTNAHPRT